jgi:hypothetical protein
MRQKRMMSTSQAPRSALTQSQTNKIADIKAQMDSIMKLANSSFSSLTDLQQNPDKTEAVFNLGSAYHRCDLKIYPGNVEDFDPAKASAYGSVSALGLLQLKTVYTSVGLVY